MKPLGMTASFQITKPTRAMDKVWGAVEEAIGEGWDVRQFIQESREAWAQELRNRASDADKDFHAALK